MTMQPSSPTRGLSKMPSATPLASSVVQNKAFSFRRGSLGPSEADSEVLQALEAQLLPAEQQGLHDRLRKRVWRSTRDMFPEWLTWAVRQNKRRRGVRTALTVQRTGAPRR